MVVVVMVGVVMVSMMVSTLPTASRGAARVTPRDSALPSASMSAAAAPTVRVM